MQMQRYTSKFLYGPNQQPLERGYGRGDFLCTHCAFCFISLILSPLGGFLSLRLVSAPPLECNRSNEESPRMHCTRSQGQGTAMHEAGFLHEKEWKSQSDIFKVATCSQIQCIILIARREIDCEGGRCMKLAQDRVQWRVLVLAVSKHQVSKKSTQCPHLIVPSNRTGS
jgi:hypothetical protein